MPDMINNRPPLIQRGIHVANQVFSFILARGKDMIGSFFIFFQLVQADQATAENGNGDDVDEPFNIGLRVAGPVRRFIPYLHQ